MSFKIFLITVLITISGLFVGCFVEEPESTYSEVKLTIKNTSTDTIRDLVFLGIENNMDGGTKKEVSYTENIILPDNIRPEIITMQAPTKFTIMYTLGDVRDTIEESNANASIGNRAWYIVEIHSLTQYALNLQITEKIE